MSITVVEPETAGSGSAGPDIVAPDTASSPTPPAPRVAAEDPASVEDDAGEPELTLTAAALGELRDLTRVRWAGWLAPIDQRAGDMRPGLPMPTAGALKTRAMPLPFFWQKVTSHGGQVVNGAVEIGALTFADIRPRPDRGEEKWIWGTGFIDLNDPDGMRYARRLDDGMSKWVSVRLDFDPTFEPPEELLKADDDGERRFGPTDHPDWWRLMNLTAESQAAFDGAEIALIDELDETVRPSSEEERSDEDDIDTDRPDGEPVALVVADGAEVKSMGGSGIVSTTLELPPGGVEIKPPTSSGPASGGSGPHGDVGGNAGGHGSGEAALVAVVTGDTSLPIADRDTPWNGPEAAKRLVEWAGGRFKLDPVKMRKVFLYRDSAMSEKMATAWKFPIADVINNQVKIVPRAVFTAAAVLRGSMGGTKIPKADQNAMKGKINTLYGRMADQFKDPKLTSPFEAVVSDGHANAMRDGDTAPGTAPPWRSPRAVKRERRSLPRLTASATSWAAEVAARVPEEPPREWFTDPGLGRACKIRVSDEGRVFGYVAAWGTEHAGLPGVHPPRNRDKSYAKFHRHPVRVSDGTVIMTGPLATGGHTSADIAMAIETVQAHYDDPRYVVADVVCGEDQWGIWVSGALRPGVSPFQVMLADRYSFSGDWRYGELLAACSVSVPGFHLDAAEEIGALTAAAAGAGLHDLPVVAEAVPALVADASGAPAVLIAAGIVVDDEAADLAVGEAIDAVRAVLQQELAALRAEFRMSDTTTATPPDGTFAQIQELVAEEVRALREALDLPEQPRPDTAGIEQPQAAQNQAPAPDTAQAAPDPAPAEGAATQPGETASAPADTAAQPAATVATASPEVAEIVDWVKAQFAALRSDRAAALAAKASTTPPATPPAATPAATTTASADVAAERRALLADVHRDEKSALFALVHGKGI